MNVNKLCTELANCVVSEWIEEVEDSLATLQCRWCGSEITGSYIGEMCFHKSDCSYLKAIQFLDKTKLEDENEDKNT